MWLSTGFFMLFSEVTWICCKKVSYTVVTLFNKQNIAAKLSGAVATSLFIA